ncbi:MAG: alpha/beta fold hydrolase [Paracoccaceae bacterium]
MPTPISKAQNLRISRRSYDLHAEAKRPSQDGSPWLVFGNSLITDMTLWDSAMPAGYGVLRYDQAGHGKSGVPTGPINFDDLGQDLLAVMDAAGIERAVYVGLSMGVPTGLAAHRIAADRFAAFVLCDGQAKTAPGGAAGWADRIQAAQTTGMQAFATATTDRWLTETASDDTRARLTQMIAATSFEGFRTCATALMDYDYADEMARITCPTLLIAGAQDGTMPEGMATKLQPAIAGAQIHIIENAGHVPCFEQPNAFAAVLLEFLETTFESASV